MFKLILINNLTYQNCHWTNEPDYSESRRTGDISISGISDNLIFTDENGKSITINRADPHKYLNHVIECDDVKSLYMFMMWTVDDEITIVSGDRDTFEMFLKCIWPVSNSLLQNNEFDLYVELRMRFLLTLVKTTDATSMIEHELDLYDCFFVKIKDIEKRKAYEIVADIIISKQIQDVDNSALQQAFHFYTHRYSEILKFAEELYCCIKSNKINEVNIFLDYFFSLNKPNNDYSDNYDLKMIYHASTMLCYKKLISAEPMFKISTENMRKIVKNTIKYIRDIDVVDTFEGYEIENMHVYQGLY
jgi:hypothetical protein